MEYLGMDITHTLFRAMGGFIIGTFVGILIGLITGISKYFSKFISSGFNFLKAITPVALAPFFLLFFGISELSRILLVSWGVFFPVWISTHHGCRYLTKKYLKSSKMMGLTKKEMIFNIYLPGSFIYNIPGIRTSIGLAFILVYISELTGTNVGLGYKLSLAYTYHNLFEMLKILGILGILGFGTDRLFYQIIRGVKWLRIKEF